MEKIDNRTEKRKTGDAGEEFAANILKQKGYYIVARNFACKCGELDIVAIKGSVIAFVEVKSRNRTDFGLPCEAVTYKKQQKLLRTVNVFLKLNPIWNNLQPRMDVFELIRSGKNRYYRHLENAF